MQRNAQLIRNGLYEFTHRMLLAIHPYLLSPVLWVVNRAISSFQIKQAGLKRLQAATGAVTLIQRFGHAANFSIQLHYLYWRPL